MAGPKTKEKQGVLLFEEDDAEAATSDPQLEQKINKYLEERTAKNPAPKVLPETAVQGKQAGEVDDEDHTGITDDEPDEEGEPDYDVASRLTLKASSEAFLEVMAEARQQYEKEKEAARQKRKAKAAAKEAPKA